MPLEESKTPAYSAYEPPPGLAVGPPPPGGAEPPGPDGLPPLDAPVRKIRGAMASPQRLPINMIVGAVVGVLLLGGLGWMSFRTKDEIKVGKPKFEKPYTVQPGQVFVEDFEATGVVPYTLELTVTDGEVLTGVIKRNPKDPRKLDAIKSLNEPLESVRKGEPWTKSGEFRHKEQWSFVVANETKKVARLKVKFQAQP